MSILAAALCAAGIAGYAPAAKEKEKERGEEAVYFIIDEETCETVCGNSPLTCLHSAFPYGS